MEVIEETRRGLIRVLLDRDTVLERLLFKRENIMEFSELWIVSYEPEHKAWLILVPTTCVFWESRFFKGFRLSIPQTIWFCFICMLSNLAQSSTLPERKEFRQCDGTHLV